VRCLSPPVRAVQIREATRLQQTKMLHQIIVLAS
jgi:hypothetical protein